MIRAVKSGPFLLTSALRASFAVRHGMKFLEAGFPVSRSSGADISDKQIDVDGEIRGNQSNGNQMIKGSIPGSTSRRLSGPPEMRSVLCVCTGRGRELRATGRGGERETPDGNQRRRLRAVHPAGFSTALWLCSPLLSGLSPVRSRPFSGREVRPVPPEARLSGTQPSKPAAGSFAALNHPQRPGRPSRWLPS